jgi:hypothetical protein
MKTITFQIDYTYCPEGHGDWVFIPSSTMYSDIFYCPKCDCFYQPSVKKIKRGEINKDYNSDREKDLIEYAEFIKWKNGLSKKDMPVHKQQVNN